MWVRPIVGKRLLQAQFHALFDELCLYSAKFSFMQCFDISDLGCT